MKRPVFRPTKVTVQSARTVITERYAGVAIEAGRNIDREDWPTGAVDVADDTLDLVARAAVEAGTQQRIDDDFSLCQALRAQTVAHAATGAQVVEGMRASPRSLSAGVAASTRDGESRSLRETREHVAVAAVVPGSADYDDAVRDRPAGAQISQGGLAGTLHQRVARNAQRLDRVGIEGTNLGGGVETMGSAMGPL